jgi:predicted dehydrogenase
MSETMRKKRYAVCGVSNRAISMWIQALAMDFSDVGELVGLLDIDPLRFQIAKEKFPKIKDVAEYTPEQLDKMLQEQKPDALIVTGTDKTHAEYVIKGLQQDLEVICEKPMTTNIADALRVMEAQDKSKGKLICTFNYRYKPIHRKLRELIIAGAIGRVTHVDLNWYVDILHGSSYFNRWNRMRENSGGLSIHKASHHFDLVNWWVDGIPEYVHAFGALNHFGANGEFNPSAIDGRHCNDCKEKMACAYKKRWATRNSATRIIDDHLTEFESEKKLFTSYRPDMCIFDSAINIHDTIIANVKYRNGVLLNYSANFSTPYEGYRLAINGTRGRLESMEYGGMGGMAMPNLNPENTQCIDYFPIFEGRERINLPSGTGGHGGGDPLILEDVFLGEDPKRKYPILAKAVDGLRAISIGDAVFLSITKGGVQDLTSFIR